MQVQREFCSPEGKWAPLDRRRGHKLQDMAIVCVTNNKVLLVQTGDGYWGFPQGPLLSGDTLVRPTAMRIGKELLGLTEKNLPLAARENVFELGSSIAFREPVCHHQEGIGGCIFVAVMSWKADWVKCSTIYLRHEWIEGHKHIATLMGHMEERYRITCAVINKLNTDNRIGWHCPIS